MKNIFFSLLSILFVSQLASAQQNSTQQAAMAAPSYSIVRYDTMMHLAELDEYIEFQEEKPAATETEPTTEGAAAPAESAAEETETFNVTVFPEAETTNSDAPVINEYTDIHLDPVAPEQTDTPEPTEPEQPASPQPIAAAKHKPAAARTNSTPLVGIEISLEMEDEAIPSQVKIGDPIKFRLSDDLEIDDEIVAPEGARAFGKVKHIGKGSIYIIATELTTANGQKISLESKSLKIEYDLEEADEMLELEGDLVARVAGGQ